MIRSFPFSTFFILALMLSCNGQDTIQVDSKSQQIEAESSREVFDQLELPSGNQVAAYVRNIYQDKEGNFWFGTNGYGVAHYDGESISYFSNAQGFKGGQITGISEDPEQNIWFATDQGVVKYDWSENTKGDKQFTSYFDKPFLEEKQFWSVFADSKGIVWAGSVSEIFRFDGEAWKPFELPLAEKVDGKFITNATTWSITEDSNGNIWFSTNGYGAFKYDGESFTKIDKEDGLKDDCIDVILEDKNGHMWFGTRFGGVSSFDGANVINHSYDSGLSGNEVCEVYEDSEGNIWFSSEGYGVYRYDGKTFRNYSKKEGLEVMAPQTIFEDKDGRMWVGGGGGLYKFDELYFTNVKRDGPWE